MNNREATILRQRQQALADYVDRSRVQEDSPARVDIMGFINTGIATGSPTFPQKFVQQKVNVNGTNCPPTPLVTMTPGGGEVGFRIVGNGPLPSFGRLPNPTLPLSNTNRPPNVYALTIRIGTTTYLFASTQ